VDCRRIPRSGERGYEELALSRIPRSGERGYEELALSS
jgi:hypothetical protein